MSIETVIGRLTFERVHSFYGCEISQDEVDELHDLLGRLWDAGLEPLVRRLAESRDGDSFRDTLFEVLVAKKFLECGAALKYEPPEYGSRPPDFLVKTEGASALVECTHPSEDWYERLRRRTESRLRKYELDVTLHIPDPVSSYEVDEERLTEEIVSRAKELKPEALFKGKLLNDVVRVEISLNPGSRRTEVRWDFDEMCWAAPSSLLSRRAQDLLKKAKTKFGELSEQQVGNILRLFVVYSYGAPGILRPHWMRSILTDRSVRESFEERLDGIMFVSRANQRIVEQVRFEEPIVLTAEAERQGRLATFFAKLGVASGSA